jgi:hypothetical protein
LDTTTAAVPQLLLERRYSAYTRLAPSGLSTASATGELASAVPRGDGGALPRIAYRVSGPPNGVGVDSTRATMAVPSRAVSSIGSGGGDTP